MDSKTTTSSESWTDEKHLRYLNSIEASFVRTMFENHGCRPLRLDRHLPDTSDSTLDSKPHQKTRKRKHDIHSEYASPRGRMEGRSADSQKTSRRSIRSSQPLNSSEDQVVPQLEIRAVGDKDERDQQSVPLAPVHASN